VVTGAQLTAASLAGAGVRRVFSVSGNQILPLYDALLDAGIAIVHARHEGPAVHMADAWARLTGTPGVALVTAGPGLANAIGGLALADAAESPLVLLAGHAPLGVAGAFQEMDQTALARPVTRWSGVAARPEEVPALVAGALRTAQRGRPGPVHLSLPVNVLTQDASNQDATGQDAAPPAGDPSAGGATDGERLSDSGAAALRDDLYQVAALLRAADRPMIVAGPAGGRPPLFPLLDEIATLTHVPFVIVDHPRGLADPALGRGAAALARADTVLLFTKRRDYRLSYGGPPSLAPDCRVVQIDPDPDEVSRGRAPDLGVVADPLPAARSLLAAVRALDWAATAWADEVAALLAAPVLTDSPPDDVPGGLHPLAVFDALAERIDAIGWDRTCLVVDGGEFGQWARARLRGRPPLHLVAEPSGAIGFAVPMALAAKLARPEATVVAIAGDGAFGFSALELETAVRCRVPFLTLVGVDGAWGTERHLQVARYGPDRAVATDLTFARYDLLASGLGAHGEHVDHPAQLRPALERALAAVAAGRPALVDVRIASGPSPAGAPP
jgi:acetolactate synthase-1/2/3 large subunit